MSKVIKGGSPASEYVLNLNKQYKYNKNKLDSIIFPKCNNKKSKLGVSHISTGGSPLSRALNIMVKRRSKCRRNPGVFPKKPNNFNLLKLSPPIYRNCSLKGGSYWKREHKSDLKKPSKNDKELFKTFSKYTKFFTQRDKDVFYSRMFFPFKTKKQLKNLKNKKASPKKAAAKKASNNATANNAVAKKASPKKAASNNAVANNAVAKKASPKKAAANNAVAKKAAANNAVANNAVAKKAASNNAVAKKAASNNAVAKKAVAKKAVAKNN
jgi:hypothetical protein